MAKKTVKKSKKMDKKLVAAKQKHEVKAAAKATKSTPKKVVLAVEKVGHSRKKVYAELKD